MSHHAKPVVVVPHDPHWTELYQLESARIRDALGGTVVAIHHIGSTSIPGIFAKPIVDILVEATALSEVDSRRGQMETLGYEVMGECGIAGRRYFRKDNANGDRIHNVHTFVAGTPGALRHLAFRDFLRAHPASARQYSDLKRKLAAAHPNSIEKYMDGKDDFIKDVEQRAIQWQSGL
jgi:GrpB-like predicted nucleotidyltransferase (UPF0157 family)